MRRLVLAVTSLSAALALLARGGSTDPASSASVTASATSTSIPVATSTASATSSASPAASATAGGPVATASATLSPTSIAPSGGAGARVQATISGFVFSAITVSRGGTVTWTNRDPVDHDVTALDGSFGSPVLHEGGTFTAQFDRAGTYAYHCTIHPFMTASVIVQ